MEERNNIIPGKFSDSEAARIDKVKHALRSKSRTQVASMLMLKGLVEWEEEEGQQG